MALDTEFYGRHIETGDTEFASLNGANPNFRGVIFDAPGKNIWVKRIASRMGPATGTAITVRYGLYDPAAPTEALNSGAQRDAYTALANPTTQMLNASGVNSGSVVRLDISTVDSNAGPSNKGAQVWSSRRYGIAVLVTGGTANINMSSTGAVGSNKNFYDRSAIAQPPPDPFGASSAAIEGHLTLWVEGEENVKPSKVVNRKHGSPGTMTASENINTLTPHFQGDFRDLNGVYGAANGGADRGDILNKVKLKVVRVSDNNVMWNTTYTATPAEQAADQFNFLYTGATLSRDIQYYWTVQVSDQFGEYSDVTDPLTFTPVSLGVISTTGPTGKFNAVNGMTFAGHWEHATALNTNAVEVTLYQMPAGSVIKGPTLVSKSVTPGSDFTITYAASGFTDLPWGVSVEVGMRGRDTSGNFSPQSNRTAFSTDKAPGVPSLSSPANGILITSIQDLRFTFSDPDDVAASCSAKIVLDYNPVLTNPDFAVDLSHWALGVNTGGHTRALTRDASIAPPGFVASGRIQVTANAGGGTSYAISDVNIPVKVGNTYVIGAWNYTTIATMVPRLAILWYDVSNALLSTSTEGVWVPAATVYTYRTFSAVAPASAVSARLGFVAFTAAGSILGSVYVTGFTYKGSITRSASFVSGTTWKYTPLSTEIELGPHSWTAYSKDVVLYSGNTTVEASAAKPSARTFTYALGPGVTVTAPINLSTVTTAGLTVNWSTTGSPTKFQVQLTELSPPSDFSSPVESIVYDSLLQNSVATTWNIPSGNYHQGGIYGLTVYVEDALGLGSTSSMIQFTVTYTPPIALASFTVVPITLVGDPWNTSNDINWSATTYGDDFEEYVIYRSDLSTPWKRIPNASTIHIIDTEPPPGVDITYTITQMISIGLDVIESVPMSQISRVDIHGIVLSSVTNGESYRMCFEVDEERKFTPFIDEKVYRPVSGAKPFTIRRRGVYWKISTKVTLYDTNLTTALEKKRRCEDLVENGGITVCYRDEDGYIKYVAIESFPIGDGDWNFFQGDLILRESNHTAGVL